MFNWYYTFLMGKLVYWFDGFFILFSDILLFIPFYKKLSSIYVHFGNSPDILLKNKIVYFENLTLINFGSSSDVVLVKAYDGRNNSIIKEVQVKNNARNRGYIIDGLTKSTKNNPFAIFENFGLINGPVQYFGIFKSYTGSVYTHKADIVAKKIIVYGGAFDCDLIADEIIIYGGFFNGIIAAKKSLKIMGGNFNRKVKIFYPEEKNKDLYKDLGIVEPVHNFKGKFIDDVFTSHTSSKAKTKTIKNKKPLISVVTKQIKKKGEKRVTNESKTGSDKKSNLDVSKKVKSKFKTEKKKPVVKTDFSRKPSNSNKVHKLTSSNSARKNINDEEELFNRDIEDGLEQEFQDILIKNK